MAGKLVSSRRFFFLLIGCPEQFQTHNAAHHVDRTSLRLRPLQNFNPKMDDPNISGGDIGHFDKNAFDKDLNDVLNP